MAPQRTRLEDLQLSRVEKLCSDLRMTSENFDVEILHHPDGVYPVKIQVTFSQNSQATTGGQIDAISTFCSRRGLSYIVLAIDGILSVEIF